MSEQTALYDLVEAKSPDLVHPDLVFLLNGYADAGLVVPQMQELIRNEMPHRVLARFDADQLYDYRSRRPVITFDHDHLTDLQLPTLELLEVEDLSGRKFLVVMGFEPDYRWEAFTASIIDLVGRFDVHSTTWVQSLPMPVPHTRNIGSTLSGNRSELIHDLSVWRPKTQLTSSVMHLVEYRLSQLDHPVLGVSLHTPHYLSENRFPVAAVAGLEMVGIATGLQFPLAELREDGIAFLESLDAQLSQNPELTQMLHLLEQRHDQYMNEVHQRGGLIELGEIPTGEELAQQLESYLASQSDEPDDQ